MSITPMTVAGALAAFEENREQRISEHGRRPELLNFIRAVEKSVRVKTIPRDKKTAFVYREGDLMTMGYIGYGDFATSVHGDDKYIVCSRHIENNKYCHSGDQHNMRMAVNMDTAVKHAKRNLTPFTVSECAITLIRGVKQEVGNFSRDVRSKYEHAKLSVGLNTSGYGNAGKAADRLMAELRLMVQSGHQFMDKELDADIRTMFAEQEEANKFRGDAVPMDFVTLSSKWGKDVVDCVRISDVTGFMHDIESVTSYDPDTVPEDISHKCAALSMCEDGHFVEGVGYRVNDRTFYLYT